MEELAPHQHALNVAPEWSLAFGTTGRVFVYIGLAFFLASFFGWLFAPKSKAAKMVGIWGFILGSVSLVATFGVLATLFANNRFEFPYVFSHSDLRNALAYRIAGVWAGQEGSFLLWALCSALFGLLTVRGTGIYRRWYTVFYSLFLASLCGVLAYESPFKIEAIGGQYLVPADGVGLAPALQNYWVIIHPPTIFLGFGSLTVMFCYALSAMLVRQPIEWAKMVRPWVLVSLTLVGVGLSMGGLWAYETLGWGGFWKWDPVENTSFVPFVLTAILTHGLIVQINRGKWVLTNLLMAGLPFLSFVYGTFLTRSGLLGETSVHSFANMAKGALWLLIGLGGLGIVGFFSVWIVRAMQLRREFAVPSDSKPGFTRESAYFWGLTLIFGLSIGVTVGMSFPMLTLLSSGYYSFMRYLLWPFAALGAASFVGLIWLSLKARSKREGDTGSTLPGWLGPVLGSALALSLFAVISTVFSKAMGGRVQEISEGLYHQFVVLLFIPIVLIMAAAPFIAWGGVGMRRLLARLYGPACVAFGMTGLTLLTLMYSPWSKLGAFEDKIPMLFTGGLADGRRIEVSALTWSLVLAGLCYFLVTVSLWTIFERWKTAKESISIYLMHAGVGVLLAGLILSRGLERTQQLQLQPGKSTFAMGYKLDILGMTRDLADRDNKVRVSVEPVPQEAPRGRSGFAKVLDKVFGGLDTRAKYVATPGLYYMQGEDGQLNPMVWPHINHGLLNDMYLALHPIAFDASDAQELKLGQSVRFNNMIVVYKEMTREGEPGMEGTKFGAKLTIHDMSGNMKTVNPTMEISSAGPKHNPGQVDDDYNVTVEGMNPADKSVTIQFHFNQPVYPIELFYKPFTSLVWGGLGILAVGGFLAAWNRRYRPKRASAGSGSEEQAAEEPKVDALAPTA